jgi:hypothetical protein
MRPAATVMCATLSGASGATHPAFASRVIEPSRGDAHAPLTRPELEDKLARNALAGCWPQQRLADTLTLAHPVRRRRRFAALRG